MLEARNPRGVGFRLPPLLASAAVDTEWNSFITDTAVGAGSSSAPRNYLNDLTSWFQALQFVLSLFATFVILWYCLRRWLPWLTRIDAKNAANSTTSPNRSHQALPDFNNRNVDSEKRPIHREHSKGKHHLHHTCGSPLRNRKPPLPWFYHLPELMDENQRTKGFGAATGMKGGRTSTSAIAQQHPEINQDGPTVAGRNMFALDSPWSKNISIQTNRQLISRPPPAPPLTPPDLSSSTVYTLDGGPINRGVPESFMHQPNPDYISSTKLTSRSNWPSSPIGSERRSFNKTLPIGVPRQQPSASHRSDSVDLAMSPSSYPPTSPILPPPPPVGFEEASDVEHDAQSRTKSGLGTEASGEYVSVVNSHGDSWTRHTRVYGGGVCLACAAAGESGGFYGANVRPEEMR